MSLLSFEQQFSNLRLNTRGGRNSPHKVAMLLAVIDQIEDGTITKNRIYFGTPLKSAFTRHFNRLAGSNDRNNPHLPFFHLRSSGFWHHHLKPGKVSTYGTLSTATGTGVITDNIAFAYLDDELFELLGYGVARTLLKLSLLKNLNKQDHGEIPGDSTAWSWLEWAKVLDRAPPERVSSVQEPRHEYLPSKVDYVELARKNRQLGELGEAFVIGYERYRLDRSGRPDLAKEVEWSSNKRGDGLGYDVRSFNPRQDEELFIEVKTTNSGKHQPFFISENEVAFSKERADQFSLYRVYDFRECARIFRLEGAVNQHVHLLPQNYKAIFG